MYEKLRTELKKRGISVYRLSFMSNIAQADLYTALKGKKPMFPNWRKRISEALEIPAEELFDVNDGKTIMQLKEEMSNE